MQGSLPPLFSVLVKQHIFKNWFNISYSCFIYDRKSTLCFHSTSDPCTPLGGFPIEIETQISKLITYSFTIYFHYKISLLILVSILIGNPPNVIYMSSIGVSERVITIKDCMHSAPWIIFWEINSWRRPAPRKNTIPQVGYQ